MSSSPFKLPSWDDVKAERRRQGRQNRIEGESSIDLSESRGATEVGGGGFNYSGNSAPSDFERLRDADLFLDTHSQASLQAQFPHPSPTRGAPYVGRYDRYLRSSQGQSEDEDEQDRDQVQERQKGWVRGEGNLLSYEVTHGRGRRERVGTLQDEAVERPRQAETNQRLHSGSDKETENFQDVELQPIDSYGQRTKQTNSKGGQFRGQQQKHTRKMKASPTSTTQDTTAFMETVTRLESNHHNRLISQFQDMLECLQRLSQAVDATSEIDRNDLQALKKLPSQWNNSFERSFPDDKKNANFSLENIAMMNMDDLGLAANDKNSQYYHEIMSSIKSSDQSLSSVPLAISHVFDLLISSFESHKKTYLSRIKTMQETANISTGNAIQAERVKVAQMMRQMEVKHEEDKRLLHEGYRNNHEEKDMKIASLQEKIEDASAELAALMRGETVLDTHGTNMLTRRDEAIRQKCQEACAVDFERKLDFQRSKAEHELQDTKNHLEDEIEKSKRDHMKQVQSIHDEYEMSIKSQAKDESQLRENLRDDKERLQEEIEILKQELMDSNNTIATERRLAESQKEIEKDRHEHELMDIRSAAMKDIALNKAEFAEVVQKHQSELDELRAKLEEAPARERAILTKAHTIEIQNLTQHAKNDLERALSHKDVKHQEEISSMKHLHGAEMKRVLRESERLKRIIARAGGMSNITSSSAAVTAYIDDGTSGSNNSNDFQEDPDPEPSRVVPSPSPRVSLDGFGGLSSSNMLADESDNRPNFWTGSTLLEKHGLAPEPNATATTLGEQEFRLHMLDDTMFTKNAGERERLYFTELQDYLEEEKENEIATTQPKREKRRGTYSPTQKFDTRRESLNFDPAVNRWKENFSSESTFEYDVRIGEEEIINLRKLHVHDSLTVDEKFVEFVLERGEPGKTTLLVKNTTLYPFVYKIKTTKPSMYSVKPNQACINPGEDRQIEITLIQKEVTRMLDEGPDNMDLSNHVFLVESKAITLNIARKLTILSSSDNHSKSKANELAERSRMYQIIWGKSGSDSDSESDKGTDGGGGGEKDENLKTSQIGVKYSILN